MKKYNFIAVIITLLMFTATTGCKKDEVKFFDGRNSVNFWAHVWRQSLYGATTAEVPQDTMYLDIALSGRKVSRDRFVTAEAVEDAAGTPEASKKTTATPDQYQIIGGVIPADSLNGKFKVVIRNPEALATLPELRLRIRMKESEDFMLGLKENNFIDLAWSREILQPATWRAMRFFFCATYSTTVYKVIMDVTGLREFYYYEGLVTQEEGYVMGKKFGDKVREISAAQGSPLLHEDGPAVGTAIIPIY
ncbi:MAG: DUF4843 domain-containing protein [Chitinophagaceae bacterium]|nr:DUF4843 domain-containing protein [Chitinophagaceae bacterium]